MFLMDFQPTEDENYLTHRMTSGRVEIGVYRVIFGYRVRAGYVGSGFYHIDYCCGADQDWIRRVYAAVLTVLTAREEQDAFKGFPVQTYKPMSEDYACFVSLCQMMKGVPPMKVEINVPPVDKNKIFSIESMFNE